MASTMRRSRCSSSTIQRLRWLFINPKIDLLCIRSLSAINVYPIHTPKNQSTDTTSVTCSDIRFPIWQSGCALLPTSEICHVVFPLDLLIQTFIPLTFPFENGENVISVEPFSSGGLVSILIQPFGNLPIPHTVVLERLEVLEVLDGIVKELLIVGK